jgi:hypothetical protein
MLKIPVRRALGVALFAAMATRAAAQPIAPRSPAAPDDVQFVVAPYLVLAGMSGTLGVRQFETTVDMSASDVLNHLSGGFMGYVAVKKGKWGFAGDTIYSKLSTEATRSGLTIEPSSSTGLYTFLATRQLTPIVELVAGARVTSTTTTIAVTAPVQRSVSDGKTWVDPIVGVNIVAPVREKVKVALLASLGGFGAASTISVDLQPVLQFRVARHAWLAAGYRYIYDDYSDDAGFVYEVTVQGPAFGVVIPF